MIQVIAESSCDLTKEMARKYHIKMVSATLEIDGEQYDDYDFDGQSLDNYYKRLSTMDSIPYIAAPEPKMFEAAFEQGVFNGITEFIVLTVSSKIHGAFDSAMTAKKVFLQTNRVQNVKIYVVDTLGSSHGCAYLLIKAAKMVEQGATFDDVVNYCEKYKTKVRHYLGVKDIDTIKKAGKMSIFAASAGKLLNIIPILTFNMTGQGVVTKKVTSMEAVKEFFVNEFAKHANIKMTDFVIIGYTTNIKYAQDIKEQLIEKAGYTGDVHIMQIRPATGSLAGNEGVTIFYMEDHAGTASISSFNKKTRKLFKNQE